jgi:hypothetical protein
MEIRNMRNALFVAALLALTAPARAEETFADAQSNFTILCQTGAAPSTPEEVGRVGTVHEVCGVALQYGYDLTLSMLAVCAKTGARGDAIVQCVKGQAATLGFQ